MVDMLSIIGGAQSLRVRICTVSLSYFSYFFSLEHARKIPPVDIV